MAKKNKAKDQLDKATRLQLLTLADPEATVQEVNEAFGMFLDACDAADAAGVPGEEQDAVVAGAGGAFNKFVAAVKKAKGG